MKKRRGCAENVTHDEFLKKVVSATGGDAGLPRRVIFEVTHRCNLNCVHCYIPEKARRDPAGELGLKETFDLLDQMSEAGVLWLCLTGGEVFCKKDFFRVYRHAIKRGFITTLYTNGTLINRKSVKTLRRYKPASVEVTLHSTDRGRYEQVTRTPGSFEKCIRGIETLRDNGIATKLKTVVMGINAGDIDGVRGYARRMGAVYTFDAAINPRLDGSTDTCGLRVSPEEVVRLDLGDKERVKGWREDLAGGLDAPCNGFFNCGSLKINVFIDPRGRLYPCTFSRGIGVDLGEHPFAEGVKTLRRSRAGIFRMNGTCSRCSLRTLCRICPIVSKIETGENRPIEYFCRLGKARRDAFLSRGILSHG